MKIYIVKSAGYDHCPEFRNLAEARACLAEFVSESMARCKRRFGSACRVKNGADNYTIRIGNAQSVSVWATHWIESV